MKDGEVCLLNPTAHELEAPFCVSIRLEAVAQHLQELSSCTLPVRGSAPNCDVERL